MEQVRSDKGRRLAVMSLGALGVVFGDIGTSPLYAFREAFHASGLAVDRVSVLGILSTMLWSLILVVTVKYLLVVMRADNEGEGGILALTALIAPTSRTGIGRRVSGLVILGLFGAALLYGDGLITPAISVLAAIEGIEIVAPGLQRFVVPLAVVILVVLFAAQRRGTAAIGRVFGPIMLAWFGTLALLGVWNIVATPSVLGAVNPLRAVEFFISHPAPAFFALGAIFLVVTGAEALYADMGHFGRDPIRNGWFLIVFPALGMNYLGQAAKLISDPGAIDSPFYRLAPEALVVPLVVLATAATVIASQALITGAFSLTAQAIQLGYLPRLRIDHTSPREIGQVYVGSVNLLLLAGSVALVIGFQSSSGLAAAYGVAVTTTMVITTLLLARMMRYRWGWSLTQVGLVAGIFLVVDVAFFSANVLKVPDGGWVPIVVGIGVLGVMLAWRRGRNLVTRSLHEDEPLALERFIGSIAAHPQQRVRGTAVYLVRDAAVTPVTLLRNLRVNEVLHEHVLLTEIRTSDKPRVTPAARATVHSQGEGFHQIRLTFGFAEEPDVPAALSVIVSGGFGFDAEHATYFLGRESVIPTGGPVARLASQLYWVLRRNTGSSATHMRLPPDRVYEVGLLVEI